MKQLELGDASGSAKVLEEGAIEGWRLWFGDGTEIESCGRA